MGMVLGLRRATDSQLNTLLRHPRLIEEFLFDEPRAAAVVRTGLMDKLISTFGFQRRTPVIECSREEGDEIDLDKSWHGMQFVLAGSGYATGGPLSFLVEEWPQIGDIDVGYGPAKAINAAAVSRFYDALVEVDAATLRAGYDPEVMVEEEIYLAEFFAENPEEGIKYIEYWLAQLRDFIKGCVARNMGVVSYIS